MRRGLTLGKFAPFHRGHQMLVKTALAEVDELVVMVYATRVTDVPLQVRAGWIRALHPLVRIIEAWDGPEGYGDTAEIRSEQEAYILGKLNGLRITHFYSSEFYGDHVSRALGAVDRRIDEARSIVPVSGTALRADYFAGRKYIDPIVYADLITTVSQVRQCVGHPENDHRCVPRRWRGMGPNGWCEHQVLFFAMNETSTNGNVWVLSSTMRSLMLAGVILVASFIALVVFLIAVEYVSSRPSVLFRSVVMKPIPRSVTAIEVPYYFNPVLGEGAVILRFRISPDDFEKMVKSRHFVKSDGGYPSLRPGGRREDGSVSNEIWTARGDSEYAICTIEVNQDHTQVTYEYFGY